MCPGAARPVTFRLRGPAFTRAPGRESRSVFLVSGSFASPVRALQGWAAGSAATVSIVTLIERLADLKEWLACTLRRRHLVKMDSHGHCARCGRLVRS